MCGVVPTDVTMVAQKLQMHDKASHQPQYYEAKVRDEKNWNFAAIDFGRSRFHHNQRRGIAYQPLHSGNPEGGQHSKTAKRPLPKSRGEIFCQALLEFSP